MGHLGRRHSSEILFVLTLVISATAFVCTDAAAVNPPGAKVSPLSPSRMFLFRDDEIFTADFYYDTHASRYSVITPNTKTMVENAWPAVGSSHDYLTGELGPLPTYWNQLASGAAGRFFDPADAAGPYRQSVAYAFCRPDGRVAVEIFDSGGRRGSWLSLDGVDEASDTGPRSVSVKVWDVDLSTDAKGRMHDEIIVARSGGPWGENYSYVDVLKVNPVTGQLTVIGSDSNLCDGKAWYVSVSTGDFNGDKFPDFAVTAAGQDGKNADIASYTFAHDDENSVTSPLTMKWAPLFGVPVRGDNMDTCAGDFDGDGKDEIFLVYGSSPIAYFILQSDANFNWKTVASHYLGTSSGPNADNNSVKCVSGNFLFDPAKGYGLDKPQVAVGWTWQSQLLAVQIFDPRDFTKQMPRLAYNEHDTTDTGSQYRVGRFSMAAGNFIGHNGDVSTSTLPASQQLLVHATWYDTKANTSWTPTWVYALDNNLNLTAYHQNATFPDLQGIPPVTPLAVAFDNDGDTWALGVPIHFTFNNVVSLDNITEEPPKHVDYLPVDPNNPQGAWDIVNVSGTGDFKMLYEDAQSRSTTNKNTNTSTWTIGGSTTLDLSSTVRAGGDIANLTVSAEAKTKLGYEYDSSKSSYNSSYHSRSQSFSAETNLDDNLHGTYKTFNVWRYPVLNYHTGNTTNPAGFWDLVLPCDTLEFSGGGKNHGDWYQPLHENDNILSYPQYNTVAWPAAGEVGCFKWFDVGDRETYVCELMNSGQEYYWGNAQTEKIEWTSASGSGSAKEYSHTLSESEEITLSVKVKVDAPLFGGKFTQSLGMDFNNANSWGGATCEDSETSESSGITLDIPAGANLGKTYGFKTAVYTAANGGAFKVAHATNPLASTQSQDWWGSYYNRKPDPALNLPNKFISHLPNGDQYQDWWTLNTDDTRKQMRGFFLRSNTKDAVSGEYPILAMAPVDGDIVQLCARIYNYSLARATGTFSVKFYYYAWDTQNYQQIGGLVTQPRMKTTVSLDGIQTPGGVSMKEVRVPWNTTGLGTANSAANVGYRFLVVLDEENAVDEIHEYKDAVGSEVSGGNNVGYWPWENAVFVFKTPPSSEEHPDLTVPDVSMPENSLAITTDDGLVTETGIHEFVKGKAYRLRVHLASSVDSTAHHPVLFFEGDPDQDGKVFASQTSFGIGKGDGYIWTTWTPKEAGTYNIYTRFLEAQDDPVSGNATASLTVTVVDKGGEGEGEGEGGGGGGCNGHNGSDPPIDGAALLAALAGFWLLFRWYSVNNKPGF